MEASKKNIGVTYGLISGLASVIFGLLLYMSGVKWFVHPVAYLSFVIPILFAVLAGLKQKKQNEGWLEFGAALKTVFTVFVIGTLISTIFNFILLNYIDEPFRQALTQETAEKTQQFLQKLGVSQDQIDKTVDDMMKGNSYTISKQAVGVAFICIFWFIISLIIAAIIKKKKPEFPAPSN
jgi:flagellar motor component MotA